MTDIHACRFNETGGDASAENSEASSWVDEGGGVPSGYCLDELLEAATDCVLILDRNWRITYLNCTAERELQQSQEIVGQTLWETFPEARGTDFERNYRKAMRERVQVAFETYYPPLAGWYEVRVSPLSSGGVGVWFSNINGRRARDDALRTLEERYRLAARATNDLLWDWDLVTKEIHWNEALEERFGYAFQNLGTASGWWIEQVHPDDRNRVKCELRECLSGVSDRFSAEYRFLRADGTYADIYDRGFVIRDGNGFPVRMVGAMQDNSERRQHLLEVARKEAHLATIFGQAMIGIMHLRADGEMLMVNERFCQIVGRDAEKIRGCSFADYTHPDDLPWNLPLFEEGLQTGEAFQIEKRYVRPDGSFVWCDVSVSFVCDQSRQVESCIVVAPEASARRAAELALASQTDLLQNVIDSVSDLIFVKDRTGRFILANRALDEGCGDLVGLCASDVKELTAQDYDSVDREVMVSGEERRIEEVIPICGEPRQFQTVKVPWVTNGEVTGVIGVSRDITERKAAEEAVRESELLYRSVLEGSPDVIAVMASDGTIELMNSAGLRAGGIELEALRGRDWASWWPEKAQKTIRAAVEQAGGGTPMRFVESYGSPQGETVWCDVLVSPICDDSGDVVRLLAVARDITQQRETSDKLKWASEHDALTELPNRRAFQARLQAATIRAMETGKQVGLLLIDLDHFKHINDTLGHAAGDHLLALVGKRLKKSLRANDFVSRLGGDEFAVILTDVDEEALVGAGNSILARLQEPIRLDGKLMTASASIGGALFPPDAESAHELFNNADTALYAMKATGRGGTKMFHQHMREQAHAAANQLTLARIAIAEQAVVPHYQQKVDLKTGDIVGFEALLRWQHPHGGTQHPDTVAEAFKDYELASRFGELMQRGVFADLRKWLDQGLPVGTIAINAAPSEFLRDDYAERLLTRIDEFGIPPHLLQIEVTEHVFLDRGSDFVGRALKVLNGAGLQVALDDFGTGYSSLSHLRDFPVDVVKIDQSFIQKMVDEPDIAAIVSAVVSLARSLKISVVAEGIENQAQLATLQAKRCAVGQGYLFGRAVAADEVPHFLRAKDRKAPKALRNVA